MYTYRAELVRVVDADTIDLRVDLGFRIEMVDRFRVAGIDAWEVRGAERERGLAAAEATRDWFARLDGNVFIATDKDRRGKYGRWLADIYPTYLDLVAGRTTSLSEFLVSNGHAEYVNY